MFKLQPSKKYTGPWFNWEKSNI